MFKSLIENIRLLQILTEILCGKDITKINDFKCDKRGYKKTYKEVSLDFLSFLILN